MQAARCAGCGGVLASAADPCPLCWALDAGPDGAGEPRVEDPGSDASGALFDADAVAYDRYLTSGRGWLRGELALGLLLRAIPRLAEGGFYILDAGGGSGRLAVRLAALGHEVMLLDTSERMLSLARDHAASAGDSVSRRLDLVQGTVEDVLPHLAARFDLILAHNLLEFVSDAERTVRLLAEALTAGGHLSLFSANRLARPVAGALTGSTPGVIAAARSQRRFTTDLFGGVRAEFSAAELEGLAARAGLTRARSFGVVIFAGVSPRELPSNPGELAAWLRLELAAAGESGYLGLARYILCLAESPA